MRPHMRTLRGRLTAAASLVALVAIAVLTVAFNIVLDRSRDADIRHRLRTQAAAAQTTVVVRDGRLRTTEAPGEAVLDRSLWVFEGRRAIERPVADASLQAAAAGLAGRAEVFADLPGREIRLYASPILADGRQIGTVVAAASLAPYNHTTDLALLGSVALAGLLLAGAATLTWIVIGRALAPVREMTRAAAAWSEHGDQDRFRSTPRPDELGELARTFDGLLDRVAASLRHEQRLSSELSHELRTPLARIVGEVELLQRRERPAAERRESYASVARSAQQMSDILETLMAVARGQAGLESGRSDVGDLLGVLHDRWARDPDRPRVRLEVTPIPEGRLLAGVDREVLERILAPLLDNARRYARSRVHLGAAAEDGRIVVTVADDGPGIPDEARERIFQPGARADQRNGHGGAGLGLALSRRLARAVGGDVTASRFAGGAMLRVELPA
ncbi:MAG: hypothetical protein QOE27_131 [Solirubrobacteraceae bacterium]|nr:hypothetical protein [Solirubrobacteraceae bacterium]